MGMGMGTSTTRSRRRSGGRSGHRMQDMPLQRSLSDGHILVPCI